LQASRGLRERLVKLFSLGGFTGKFKSGIATGACCVGSSDGLRAGLLSGASSDSSHAFRARHTGWDALSFQGISSGVKRRTLQAFHAGSEDQQPGGGSKLGPGPELGRPALN
jgi:hypothetical protein